LLQYNEFIVTFKVLMTLPEEYCLVGHNSM